MDPLPHDGGTFFPLHQDQTDGKTEIESDNWQPGNISSHPVKIILLCDIFFSTCFPKTAIIFPLVHVRCWATLEREKRKTREGIGRTRFFLDVVREDISAVECRSDVGDGIS